MIVPAEQVPAYLAASLAFAGIDWRNRPESLRNGFAAYRDVTAPESLELHSLLDTTRKTYVIVLAGPETADDWARKLAEAAEQRLALHGALLRFGVEGDMSLPMQGAAPEEMIACKDRALTQILS